MPEPDDRDLDSSGGSAPPPSPGPSPCIASRGAGVTPKGVTTLRHDDDDAKAPLAEESFGSV